MPDTKDTLLSSAKKAREALANGVGLVESAARNASFEAGRNEYWNRAVKMREAVADLTAAIESERASADRVGSEGWKRLAQALRDLGETDERIKEISERYGLGASAGAPKQRQVREDSQGLGEPGRLSPSAASAQALTDEKPWPFTGCSGPLAVADQDEHDAQEAKGGESKDEQEGGA